jgi:hypothetical protein
MRCTFPDLRAGPIGCPKDIAIIAIKLTDTTNSKMLNFDQTLKYSAAELY